MERFAVLVKAEDFLKSKAVQKVKQKKINKVFKEWGEGKLHSGSKHGPKVSYEGKRNPQAIAIALSEGRKAAKKARKKEKK